MQTKFKFLTLNVLLISLSSISLQAQKIGNPNTIYNVVVNHEEQYSIVLKDQRLQKGWEKTKMTGNFKKCQAYIEEVWTDMRPLSIRKKNLSDGTSYRVVINHEEQYSIWPAKMRLPKGWKSTRTKGSLDKCQAHIEGVWTDMRPLSTRKWLDSFINGKRQ